MLNKFIEYLKYSTGKGVPNYTLYTPKMFFRAMNEQAAMIYVGCFDRWKDQVFGGVNYPGYIIHRLEDDPEHVYIVVHMEIMQVSLDNGFKSIMLTGYNASESPLYFSTVNDFIKYLTFNRSLDIVSFIKNNFPDWI